MVYEHTPVKYLAIFLLARKEQFGRSTTCPEDQRNVSCHKPALLFHLAQAGWLWRTEYLFFSGYQGLGKWLCYGYLKVLWDYIYIYSYLLIQRIFASIYLYIYIYIYYVHMCIQIFIYIYIYPYIAPYIYMQRYLLQSYNKCTYIQTYRHTDIHTYIYIYTHTYIHAHIHPSFHASIHPSGTLTPQPRLEQLKQRIFTRVLCFLAGNWPSAVHDFLFAGCVLAIKFH